VDNEVRRSDDIDEAVEVSAEASGEQNGESNHELLARILPLYCDIYGEMYSGDFIAQMVITQFLLDVEIDYIKSLIVEYYKTGEIS
jgi:hypothetical protein